jgi:hypothetical protein
VNETTVICRLCKKDITGEIAFDVETQSDKETGERFPSYLHPECREKELKRLEKRKEILGNFGESMLEMLKELELVCGRSELKSRAVKLLLRIGTALNQ